MRAIYVCGFEVKRNTEIKIANDLNDFLKDKLNTEKESQYFYIKISLCYRFCTVENQNSIFIKGSHSGGAVSVS